MGKSKVKINIILSSIGQIVSFLLNFIVPKFIIISYGSEFNGLISTIAQIFSYLALIEAGIANSCINELYAPIINGEEKKINDILSSSQKSYLSTAKYYLLGVVLLGILLPFCLETNINYFTIFCMIFLNGIGTFISFCFVATYRSYLTAKGYGYLDSIFVIIYSVLLCLLKILFIFLKLDPLFLQVAFLLANIVLALIFGMCFKMKFPEISINLKTNSKLSNRKFYFIHELTTVVFNSTDLIIISIFCGLAESSKYSIHLMAFSALNVLLNTLFRNLSYSLSQKYKYDIEEYKKYSKNFEKVYICCSFVLFTAAYLLSNSFVLIYMSGSNEQLAYVDKFIPLLLAVVNMLSSIRVVSGNLINVSGNVKKEIKPAIIEAIINLIVSVVLVQFIGIYGVLIGTIVALLYRSNEMKIFSNKMILKIKSFDNYGVIIYCFCVFILTVILVNVSWFEAESIFTFCLYGVCLTFAYTLIYFLYYMLNKAVNYFNKNRKKV